MRMEAAPIPVEAPHPFNNPKADTILRSADHVDFRVHSIILIEASPFFRQMFSLPQPSNGSQTRGEGAAAVIEVAEDERMLNSLLRLCYPIAEPKLEELQDIEDVLGAAMKYEMEQPIARLTRMLRARATNEPLRVWAIASRLGIEEEAWNAAQEALARPIPDKLPSDIGEVSAGVYYRLLKFLRLKGSVDDAFKFCSPPPRNATDGGSDSSSSPNDFFTHSFADIICRSSDGVDFRVHRITIFMASPVLHEMISNLTPSDSDMNDAGHAHTPEDGLMILNLPEPSRALSLLFKLCYPVDAVRVISDDLAAIEMAAQAAEKYEMKAVTNTIDKSWDRLVRRGPLRAYIVTARAQLEEYARKAARASLRRGNLEDDYVSEMEDTSAAIYSRLLEYRKACRDAVATRNKNLRIETWWEPEKAQQDEAANPKEDVEMKDETEKSGEEGTADGDAKESDEESSTHSDETAKANERSCEQPEDDCRCSHHGNATVITRGKCMKCARKWIREEVQDACDKYCENPDAWSETAQSVLVQSVEEGYWCSECEQIARFLTRLDSYVYKELKDTVSAIDLTFHDTQAQ